MNETEVLDATTETVKQLPSRYHVQVRVTDTGSKGDGRKGTILLEDDSAPYEVVLWLKSNKCKKKNNKKAVIIYVNEEKITSDGINTTPDDEDAPTPPVPQNILVPPYSDPQLLIAFIKRLEQQISNLEKDCAQARENYYEEIKIIRQNKQKELDDCNEQIRQARERAAQELQREVEDLNEIVARRRLLTEERTRLAVDFAEDQEQVRDTRKAMQKYNNSSGFDSIADNINKIATGIQGTPVEGLIQMLIQKYATKT